jgi:5-methylcytosine-specific restriction protein A
MPSRKHAWMRDELILALELYDREGPNPSSAAKEELSAVLRAIPVEPELADDPRFRNRPGISLKVSNFAAIDPSSSIAGMPHVGRGDIKVWEEFNGDRGRLRRAAEAIRANIMTLTPTQASVDEDDVEEAEEGRILTRTHRARERDEKLRAARCEKALEENGVLACGACGFDFEATYGVRGKAFIECHHTKPLSELKPGTKTLLKDLALLCSNCHRMIHVRRPWLTVEQLKALISP